MRHIPGAYFGRHRLGFLHVWSSSSFEALQQQQQKTPIQREKKGELSSVRLRMTVLHICWYHVVYGMPVLPVYPSPGTFFHLECFTASGGGLSLSFRNFHLHLRQLFESCPPRPGIAHMSPQTVSFALPFYDTQRAFPLWS